MPLTKFIKDLSVFKIEGIFENDEFWKSIVSQLSSNLEMVKQHSYNFFFVECSDVDSFSYILTISEQKMKFMLPQRKHLVYL